MTCLRINPPYVKHFLVGGRLLNRVLTDLSIIHPPRGVDTFFKQHVGRGGQILKHYPKNLHSSIFIAKNGPKRVVKDRKKWSKIGGSTVCITYSSPSERVQNSSQLAWGYFSPSYSSPSPLFFTLRGCVFFLSIVPKVKNSRRIYRSYSSPSRLHLWLL